MLTLGLNGRMLIWLTTQDMVESSLGLLMVSLSQSIVSTERRVWIRISSHTVVFDRDAEFDRYVNDPSGSVIQIVHLWLADAGQELPAARHYLGSVRRYESGDWVSRRELFRLFRRARAAAGLLGGSALEIRHMLIAHLRSCFGIKASRVG